MTQKIRVGVLYGGKSGEHEISLISAASVIRHLDRSKFELIPIHIDRKGRWHLSDLHLIDQHIQQSQMLPVFKNSPEVLFPPRAAEQGHELIPLQATLAPRLVDVMFPVMHGTFCEDGSIQGLLDLAEIPYVGCGVLASAIGMDKEVAKRLARDAGIPIVPYLLLRQASWKKEDPTLAQKAQDELGFPVFVKPVNAGSSLGTHKVKTPTELAKAISDAFRYDSKVLLEKAISAREIELSVLEEDDPERPFVSVPGEIEPLHEFYSYEAKYVDKKGANLVIPAKLTADQQAQARKIAGQAFLALGCQGMARVDLFLDRDSEHWYFNEVNTIPGFTSISMYPKLMEASGVSYTELLTRLIDLAINRHRARQGLLRERG